MENEKCCFDAMCENDDGKAALEAGQLGEPCQTPGERWAHSHRGRGGEGAGKWVRIPHRVCRQNQKAFQQRGGHDSKALGLSKLEGPSCQYPRWRRKLTEKVSEDYLELRM